MNKTVRVVGDGAVYILACVQATQQHAQKHCCGYTVDTPTQTLGCVPIPDNICPRPAWPYYLSYWRFWDTVGGDTSPPPCKSNTKVPQFDGNNT